MAISIDATVGGASANSFVTESEQIAYMAARTNASAWTSVSGATCTEDEKKAMIQATRELSSRSWQGTRVTSSQALSWPRQFVIDPDAPWAGSTFYSTTAIPQRVKDATCELAFQFLNLGTTDLSSYDDTRNIRRKQIDVIATEYFDPWARPAGLAQFPLVLRWVQPLLANGSRNNTEVIRG